MVNSFQIRSECKEVSCCHYEIMESVLMDDAIRRYFTKFLYNILMIFGKFPVFLKCSQIFQLFVYFFSVIIMLTQILSFNTRNTNTCKSLSGQDVIFTSISRNFHSFALLHKYSMMSPLTIINTKLVYYYKFNRGIASLHI